MMGWNAIKLGGNDWNKYIDDALRCEVWYGGL